MINSSKIESLNCKIHESIQKIEIIKLTSNKDKFMVINLLKEETIELNKLFNKLKEKKVERNE